MCDRIHGHEAFRLLWRRAGGHCDERDRVTQIRLRVDCRMWRGRGYCRLGRFAAQCAGAPGDIACVYGGGCFALQGMRPFGEQLARVRAQFE